MKKKLLGIAMCCAMMLCAACENQIGGDSAINNNEEELQEVNFSVVDFEKTLKQMGVGKADTRALSDNASYLKLALFLGEEKKYEFSQTAEDENFGSISALLVPEDYKIVVIASKVEMEIEAPTNIHPVGEKVNDTFYHYGTLSKDDIKSGNVAINLNRAVALFLIQTDAKPSEVTSFALEIKGASNTFDAEAGFGVGNTTLSSTFDVSSRTSVYCGIYVFLPSTDSTVTVTTTAYDANNNVVKTHTFNGVQMKPGYTTQYSGNFFQVNASWSITINDAAWPEAIKVPFDLSSL